MQLNSKQTRQQPHKYAWSDDSPQGVKFTFTQHAFLMSCPDLNSLNWIRYPCAQLQMAQIAPQTFVLDAAAFPGNYTPRKLRGSFRTSAVVALKTKLMKRYQNGTAVQVKQEALEGPAPAGMHSACKYVLEAQTACCTSTSCLQSADNLYMPLAARVFAFRVMVGDFFQIKSD